MFAVQHATTTIDQENILTTPYVGEIQIFGFNYAPLDWLPCNGATLSAQQYPMLFALIGFTYGGDGKTNFKVPNFTGSAACSQGTGTNLTPRTIGKNFGEASVTLTSDQMPTHTHAMIAYHQSSPALKNPIPVSNNGVATPSTTSPFVPTTTVGATFSANTIGNTGGGLPHENRQPLLALNFCIATEGEYPAFD